MVLSVKNKRSSLCHYRLLLQLPRSSVLTSEEKSPPINRNRCLSGLCAVISNRLWTCSTARHTKRKTMGVRPTGWKTRGRKSARCSPAFMPVMRSVVWLQSTSATACSSVSSIAAKALSAHHQKSQCWCRSGAKPGRSPTRTVDAVQSSSPEDLAPQEILAGLFY